MTALAASERIDFIGVGPGKSGTTWVESCLARHPSILLSSDKTKKEVKFFNQGDHWCNYDKGMDWYLAQFPAAEPGKLRGEISPQYLVNANSAGLIHRHLPDVKLIVNLRHPVDYVYSRFQWAKTNIYHGDLPDRFEEAVAVNPDMAVIVDEGRYSVLLQRFYDLFPAEQIHVILMDDIREAPETCYQQLCDFLGVEPGDVPATVNERVNPSRKTRLKFVRNSLHGVLQSVERLSPRLYSTVYNIDLLHRLYAAVNLSKTDYEPLSAETRAQLLAGYRDDIVKTSAMIGRDLSQWLD